MRWQPQTCWINLVFLIFAIGTVNVQAKKTEPKKQVIDIAFLLKETSPPPVLSNITPNIPDKGIPGAQLAIADNNTTGQFTGQDYQIKTFTVPKSGNSTEVFNQHIAGKFQFLITALPAAELLALADLPAAQSMLILDAATTDDALRGEQCRRNIVHLMPSRAMRTDALAQYLLKKRWTKAFLVIGPQPEDRLYADAIKRSAKKLNITLIAEKTWEHNFESRHTAQADVAVFTQLEHDYDVLIVADEQGLFGDYLDYRTWSPRPVVGTQGLIATSWHLSHEQWGAIQMQNRFKELAGRWMEEIDYTAYLAVRALGEAATRTKSNQLQPIKDFLLSSKFTLQGYKGSPLSFRLWDGQLRQPILLAAPRALVSVAPIEGFLHPTTELDTLGFDQPETSCHWQP